MSTSLGLYGNNKGFFQSIMGRVSGLPQKLAPSHMGGQMQGRPWDNRQIEAIPRMAAAEAPSQQAQVKAQAPSVPAAPATPATPVGRFTPGAQTQGFGRQTQAQVAGSGLLGMGMRK